MLQILLASLVASVLAVGARATETDLSPTPPGAKGMNLVFSETFKGPLSLCSEICNGEKWRTKYYHSGDTPLSRGLGMSGETEVYMDPNYLGLGIDPFQINNGILTITASPASDHVRQVVQAAWPAWWQKGKIAPAFTSGVLTTEKSYHQQYGYFEARIKFTNIRGAFPAFWLYDLHDNGDEIDVAEVLGGLPSRLYSSIHHYIDHKKHNIGVTTDTSDLSEEFHTYGVRWTADEVAFYLDNVKIGSLVNIGLHQPMQILLDLAMDGNWNHQLGFITAPDSTAALKVQFVKAYQ